MAASTKVLQIGVMAEEHNDVDVLDKLTSKVMNESMYKIHRFVGHGCGKLRRKCESWTRALLAKGCSGVVLMHDLDSANEKNLRKELESRISTVRPPRFVVLIPTKELEAWLLADAPALKSTFGMRSMPRVPTNTEEIQNPKEYLRDLVAKNSKTKYVNTVHNVKIAEKVSLRAIERCLSFCPYLGYLDAMRAERAGADRADPPTGTT